MNTDCYFEILDFWINEFWIKKVGLYLLSPQQGTYVQTLPLAAGKLKQKPAQ
jgi:hypothetical protein